MSTANASYTGCWEWKWTVPTTTYASGIVYWCDGNTPIITIYWENWNWEAVWITIKAMNEWATVIWAKNVNTGSYWYHFQWWNNHGFESCYSNRWKTFPWWEWTGSIQVNVINYGPVGKSLSWYYDSGTWISKTQWSTDNRNLWGGSWDEKNLNWMRWFNTWDFEVTNPVDRQAMCPEWYHIPSQWEWSALLYLWWKNYDANQWTSLFTRWSLNSLNNNLLNGTGNRFSEDMQIPFVGDRRYDGTVYAGGYGNYWSSSPYDDDINARHFYLGPNTSLFIYHHNRGNGNAVRCFKNSYVKLPKTLNLFFMPSTGDVQEVWTWEVTENMTGVVPEKAKNMTKTWYVPEYRYLSGADATTWFDFETTPISWAWADESGNVYFIAQWTGIKYSVEFTWTDVEWAMPMQELTYDITWALTPNAFTKNWYTFSWWTDWTTWYVDGQEVINLTTTGGDIITLTAEWAPIDYAITYNLDWWTNSDDNPDTYTIESNEIRLKEPTKDNHTFEWRYTDADFTDEITSIHTGSTWNITLYAKWKKKSSGWSGWGGRSSKTWDTQDSSDKSSEWQTWSQEILSPADDSFTKEQKDAYTFAFKNGITTMNTIDKANMDWYIKRWHLAKMVVNYVTNVLWREIPSDIPAECLSWTDTYRESDEIKDYATKSCALWLMWIEVNHKFDPEKIVPRSQFGAVISRVLWWDKYNLVHTKEKPRYTDHLNALKDEWIMTKIDNPKMQEKRWYVMIMLMRSTKWK